MRHQHESMKGIFVFEIIVLPNQISFQGSDLLYELVKTKTVLLFLFFKWITCIKLLTLWKVIFSHRVNNSGEYKHIQPIHTKCLHNQQLKSKQHTVCLKLSQFI